MWPTHLDSLRVRFLCCIASNVPIDVLITNVQNESSNDRCIYFGELVSDSNSCVDHRMLWNFWLVFIHSVAVDSTG